MYSRRTFQNATATSFPNNTMRLINILFLATTLLLLLQFTNCEKPRHCKNDDQCAVKIKKSNDYDATYRKKYEKYAATKKIELKKPTPPLNNVVPQQKDCNKRKYQLNCNKTWQKSKNGERTTKNGKVYIKRENNLLLNLDDDDNNLKRKKPITERKNTPTTQKNNKMKQNNNKKENFKFRAIEKIDSSSSDEDGSDNEWW